MIALVTGASGFLGRHLCRTLIERGDTVLMLSRRPLVGDELRGAKWCAFDLLEQGAIDGAGMARGGADAVLFHLAAAIPRADANDRAALLKTNAAATGELFSRAAQLGVGHFVYASSISVYGPPGVGSINEKCVPQPDTDYGQSKLAGEQAGTASATLGGVGVTSLRITSIYGAGMNENSIIPALVGKALRGENYGWYGSGERGQDYVHVDDVVAAMTAAADYRPCGAFNIAAGKPVTNRALVETIKRLTPWSTSAVGAILLPDPEEGRVWQVDAGAAKHALRWKARTDLVSGLAQYVASRHA